jgi:uncharacterized protein with PIN domain
MLVYDKYHFLKMKNLTIISDDPELVRWLRFAGISSYSVDNMEKKIKESSNIWYVLKSPVRFINFPSDQKIYVGTFEMKIKMQILQKYISFQNQIRILSRCSRCNSELVEVSKQSVADRLPPKVKKYCTRFFICKNCGKLYWNGTHYQRIIQKLQEVLSIEKI